MLCEDRSIWGRVLKLTWHPASGHRATELAPDTFFGWLLVGWGLFNLVEGIVDHQILTIHHVREGADNTWLYDGGFLAFGALLLVGGWLLTRSPEARLIKPS
jgi:uncharacterized membrane protein